jgi:exosortase F-associated protein
MTKRIVKIFFLFAKISSLIGILILIRAYENSLFYDPFLEYFKSENPTEYPKYNLALLIINLIIRYFINSAISLGIIYLVFKDKSKIFFLIYLYIFLLLILLGLFIFVLEFLSSESKMILFYSRRFIIQPLFLLLFIPGFYSQQQAKK